MVGTLCLGSLQIPFLLLKRGVYLFIIRMKCCIIYFLYIIYTYYKYVFVNATIDYLVNKIYSMYIDA